MESLLNKVAGPKTWNFSEKGTSTALVMENLPWLLLSVTEAACDVSNVQNVWPLITLISQLCNTKDGNEFSS